MLAARPGLLRFSDALGLVKMTLTLVELHRVSLAYVSRHEGATQVLSVGPTKTSPQ
ncbi:hypothetical protein BC829DRAFT_408248 [Chytridium lagenaria]|nr:hypothetical protein BC829DRAFT_408248 [Chytridium lagenaria]